VGTAWQGGKTGDEDIIRNCYRSVFEVAVNNNIASLAIPLLASGSYGFPKGIALRIALSEIEAFMSESDMDVYLVVFDEKSVSLSSELYGDIDEYINDNYVEEKNQEEYPDSYGRTESVVQRSESFAGGLASIGAVPRFLKANKAEKRKKKGSNKKAESIEAAFEDEEEMLSSDMCLSAPILEEERSLDDVVNNLDKTFMELVFSFADAKGLTDVEVQKKANLDRKAFSKLKCGTTKNPSKSTALALAVALELDLDDTKDLLSRAGLALSPCSKQDVIVQYFIEKEAYDIYEINVALFEHGEQLLGTHVSKMSPGK
jgi:transcriptional regulator with XRE-family HTH domain